MNDFNIKVSSITITFSDYRDMEIVYRKVSDTIRTLLESGYIIIAYNYGGNKDFVTIEYVVNTPNGLKPYWLEPDEAEAVESYIAEKDLAHHKEAVFGPSNNGGNNDA